MKSLVGMGRYGVLLMVTTAACGSPGMTDEGLDGDDTRVEPEPATKSVAEPLAAQTWTFWRAAPGSAVTKISVCFEPGWTSAEKTSIKSFASAWERGGVDFTYWGDCKNQFCNTDFFCAGMPGIHLRKGVKCSVHSNLGTELDGVIPGIEFEPSPSKYCVVHELGHALGFTHEQERTDNTACDADQTQSEPDFGITSYDNASIMSYCGPNNGTLTSRDIDGLTGIYGGTGSTVPYSGGADDFLHFTPQRTLAGTRIALRSAAGPFLRARAGGGDVLADQNHVRNEESLTIVDGSGHDFQTVWYNDVVQLVSRDGFYLRALTSSDNWAVDQSTIDGVWERWVIVNANDPSKTGPVRINEEVAFRSAHGRYLYRQDSNGNVRAHNTAIQSLEKWRILWLPFGEDV